MSVEMPPELAWVARLAVGQAWPKGQEDSLHALGQAWHEAAQELKGVSQELGSSGNGVLESVGGQVADEFRAFVTQLESSLPEMAQSADQLGKLGKHTAVQVEYSKYMILGQLILLAAQIAQWIFFAPEVIPAAITSARLAVKMILHRLAISVATGVALNVGLDVAVQTLQFLKGDRTEWSKENTVSAVVSGAVGGAVGGVFFGVGSVLRPKFTHSLLGKGILGAATGVGTAGIMYGIYRSGQDEFGTSVSAGALGALGGGGKRRFGGKGDTVTVDPVQVNVPGALTFDQPGLVPTQKTESSGPDTFKEASGGTSGPGNERQSAFPSGTSTGPRTETPTSAPATGHDASASAAARDGRELPGFTTTVIAAPHTTTSSTEVSSVARTSTAATAPTRTTTGAGGTGVNGTGNGSTGRPPTAGTSSTAGPAPSVRTETGATARTGTGTSVRTETGAAPSTGASTRTEPETVRSPTSGTVTTTASTETRTADAGAAPRRTATATETAVATDTTAATAHRRAVADPTPDPTPPPAETHQAPAPRMKLDRTPRFVVRSSFEARRFLYRDEHVTDLTIRVAFRGGGGGPEANAVWDRMSEGVRRFLNDPGYHLPNGDRLHVTVLRARSGDQPHLTVDLVGHDRPMDQRSWWTDAEPVDYAHEVAHQVFQGRDEYADATAPHRAGVAGSLMGDYRAPAPEGMRQAGLRDRNLHLIHALIGDLGEPTSTRHTDEDTASATRRQDEAFSEGEEWGRVWQGATVHERRHAWVDPVSDPRRDDPRNGSGQTMSAAMDPRTTRPADADAALAAALLRRRQDDSDEEEVSGAESDWGSDTRSEVPIFRPVPAVPAPYRFTGPAPTHGTSEAEGRTAHTEAAAHQQVPEEATVPAPVVPLLDALPRGPFEARTLWGDEPFVRFGLRYQKIRFPDTVRLTPASYSHEEQAAQLLGHGENDSIHVWTYRIAAYSAVAQAASHRLHLILDRAQETADRAEPGSPERERALRLLKTELSLRDSWEPSYRSEFLRLQMMMEESNLFENLPNELVVNDRWTAGPEDIPDTVRPWALVSRTEQTGPLGGSLYGPHGASGRFLTWLEQNGGDSSVLSEWAKAQSYGSNSPEALRFKLMLSHFHPSRDPQGFYMHRLESAELRDAVVPYEGHPDALPVAIFEPSYLRTMVAQHVFTHEILTRVRMPNVDPDKGIVQLMRLDRRSVVDEANGGRPPDIGALITLQRGPSESFSLLTPYKDPKVAEGNMGPFWVTSQNVPLHQVFGTYLQTRLPDNTSDAPSLFLGEGENEFLAMSDGADIVFHETNTPPVLAVPHAPSTAHPDEAAPRAPVAEGVERPTTSTETPAPVHPETVPTSGIPSHPPVPDIRVTDTEAQAPASVSENRSARVVAPAEARSLYGMPEKNFDRFQRLSRTRKLRIDVRPTNNAAPDWLDQGKLPKPKDIKAKSVNDLDVLLGAKEEHRGLIGYFEPTRPERGNLDDGTWDRLQKRFTQRAEEFETLAPVMADLQAQGRFKVEGGLVYGRDGQGSWTEITGDHDVFDISTPGGTRLAGEPYHEVVNTMMAADMAVMHGAHMDWEPSTPFSKDIFSKIVESHQEGREPLLRFRPDVNDAELVYAPSEFLLTVPDEEPFQARQTSDAGSPASLRAEPATASAPTAVEPENASTAAPMPGNTTPPPEPLDRATPAAELPVEPLAEPPAEPPTGPPARLGGPYQRSLTGIRITDTPSPDQLRARVLQSLRAEHRTERQVLQKLDAEFDAVTFRARHDEMVNGGWRFPLRVGGAPHEVVLTARPSEWRLRAEQTSADEREPKGFERSAEVTRPAQPKKTALTTSEAGLDLAPTVIRPVPGHDDQLAVVSPSVKAGGATHAADTSVQSGSGTGTKTALTGPTDTYVSRFHYETRVVDPNGRSLAPPADGPLVADVTADITRVATDRTANAPASWQGWESARPGRAEGRPLDVTGLSALHDDVFRHLPRERRPGGTAHRDILEFLSPKNVVAGFDHAAGWGLTSQRLNLSDGGHAWLRLTLEPGGSVHEGTVSDKDTVTSKESAEHAVGRTDTSTWGLGLNGGGARRVWQSRETGESAWLTATGGYSYAHNRAHQEKGKQTFSLEHSLEQAGTGDLIRTAVRFRVEVLRDHLSPGTDGFRAVRPDLDPAGARGRAPLDEENPPAVRMGEVVRLRAHANGPTPATAPEASVGPRPVPGDLRAPLTSQRTAFVDVPGSRELERHISDRLRELAPGVLPPPDGSEGRVTPQAMENQRLLRESLSPSSLRAAGGQLLDGTFRFTLDASHLPGLPSRSYEVVVGADTAAGRHEGPVATTAKTAVTRGHASDKGVTRGSKHTLGISGNGRRALNPGDTVRVFGLLGLDGSYAPSRQTVASSEIQAKRAFQHKGQADEFSYPARYRVLVGPYRESDPVAALPAGHGVDDQGPGRVREVVPADGGRLRVEVRRAEISVSAPRYLRPDRLPQLHAITHVGDEAAFRQQAKAALEQAYQARRTDDRPHVPALDEAVADLTGRAQLPGLVSASHAGWANTLDRHVGVGRAPDTVGLSVRTRLIDLTYQETLSGPGTLDLELKASGGTALTDQTAWSAKGNIGPDAGRFPETATGQLTTAYQLRGGGRIKGSGQVDHADTYKQVTSTTRTAGHTGTWHVYRAAAEVSVAGRVTDATGTSYAGRPLRRDHDLLVLLSDEDVARLHAETTAPETTALETTAPETPTSEVATASVTPRLRPTLLEQGISGGVLVEFTDTDPVLREIDRQLRGPAGGAVPVAALPFADTYTPDSLAARYDELVGPGILDRHVEVTRAGSVVTEVLVRGFTDGWRDDGSRADRSLTRDVSVADTVKGKAGHKWSAGAEGTLRVSVRPPVSHLNSASLAPSASFEAGRGAGAESGVTTTVGHKTSGFGEESARFTTNMRYEVTVTRRTETGRFVRLTEDPATVGPYRATAWVPASLTERTTATPHPRMPDDPLPPGPSAAHPFDIELGRTAGRTPVEHLAWQSELRAAHDLVGFDNAKVLHDTAVQVQATPRPWGEGLLAQTGAYYSWALAQGAGLARWAAGSTLPAHLTGTVSRFLDTFTADPRLGSGHDLSQEQRLPLEEQFAIRQLFSGHALPALFHRLAAPGGYRVPGTSVVLSMEAIGPAEELSRRDAAADELTLAAKDETGTSATHGYNWTVSPFDFAVLTDDPVVTVPLVTGRMAREQDYDSARPVTRAPGTPSRPTPDTALPHGRTSTEPGKAKVTGPTALMRQPVRITLHGHDDQGPYGTPRTVTGHVFHWSAPHEAAPPSPSPRPAPRRRPAAAPVSDAVARHPDEASPRAPRNTGQHPAETTGPVPHTDHRAAAAGPVPTAAAVHGIVFADEDVTTPGPAEAARLDAIALEVARDTVGRPENEAEPPAILITGHGTASASGLPHFGRAVQIGAERAETVRELFARRLDARLRDLESALTSDAFPITVESRGPDLPRDTDPAHDTPEARRRVVVTITRPDATAHGPSAHHDHPAPEPLEVLPSVSVGRLPLRPEQWRSRRDHAVWAVLRTERYDPARDPAADRPGPGLLAGRDVVVRAAIARIQADDGRWIRNLSLHLPVRFGDGFGPGDLGAYRERLQSLLDTHINYGRHLPGSGDQVHIDVDLEHLPDHPEAVEISRSERPRHAWDQFTFPLGTHEGIRDDARALHELLHYATGLKDEYEDAGTLFRRHERQTRGTGLMADIDSIDVPDRYLRTIAEVTESGPVLRDLPYTGDDGGPAVTPPGPTRAEARDILLSVDAEPVPPVRPPAAAPFSDRSAAEVADLIHRVRHENTEMDHGRNWRGPGRPRFDPTAYRVRDVEGSHQAAAPWGDGAYVVLARASGGHITLETPSGKVRLTHAEDFAALLADDPLRPPDADIVLAVRGLPQDALGLSAAVFAATGNRVWTPSGGSLELRSVRTRAGTVERVELTGRDPHWAPTTSTAGPDHFAHLRAHPLITDAYTAEAADGVLFHRLPVTEFEVHHSLSSSDPRSPALVLPTQRIDVVYADAAEPSRIRVSQDGTLAIDADGMSQHAYATERAIEQANAKLAAAGSKVRLAAEPEAALTLRRDGDPAGTRLLRITPQFLTSSGRSEEEPCRDFAQMVSGQVRASHVVFRVPGRPVVTGGISALDTAEVTGTHHLAESLAQVADGLITPEATGPVWAAAQIARDDRGVGGQGGAPLPGEAYGTALSHELVDDPRRDALTRAARRTGINAGAWAEVGEGYLIQSINAPNAVGDPTLAFNYAKPWAQNESHFGYHFASVVLASEDGQAQLTLENHARVGRNRMEMTTAVEKNLVKSAVVLRALAASLHVRARYAEQVGAPSDRQNSLKARARLTDRLVEAREARDRGAPEEVRDRTFLNAATAMLRAAPMIDGKAQWYFRSYSKRPGESMHESHAALLSDHASAEANPLTLVVLHGHGTSAPEHRFIPFEASGAMAESAGYKLDHLAEHLARTGLWNLTHQLPLPTTRLTGHGEGPAHRLDLDRTNAMVMRARDELRARVAAVLLNRGAAITAEAFTISVASSLRRDNTPVRGPGVTFEVDHWRAPHTDQ